MYKAYLQATRMEGKVLKSELYNMFVYQSLHQEKPQM